MNKTKARLLRTLIWILLIFIAIHFLINLLNVKDEAQTYADFKKTSCLVQDKGVVDHTKRNGVSVIGNFPEILVEYNIIDKNSANKKMKADAQITLNEPVYEGNEGQKILEDYTVGNIYPCWYAQATPSNVILKKPSVLPVTAAEFVIIVLLILADRHIKKMKMYDI